MIVNIYTLIMLFVAIFSLSLGGILFLLTIKTLISFKTTVPLEDKTKFEQKGYLVFLLACVTLSIRMIVWPWFYFMLQSFVSEIPGAMWYVWRYSSSPVHGHLLQIIKPISFFIMGGWLLCYYVDKSLPTTPLARKTCSFFSSSAAYFLADGIGDIYYVIRMKPLMSVSCCATFLT